MSVPAAAWTATYLQGSNWAITCANGQSYSYNGSSAGLDVVGPALCPGGVVNPNGGDGLTAILNFEKENAGNRAAGFPPKGYPCLGCEPCPGNPAEYCSTTDGIIGEGSVVWSVSGMDRVTKDFMTKRYNLPNRLPAQPVKRKRKNQRR